MTLMIAATLARLGLGAGAVRWLTSPTFWAAVLLVGYSLWLIDWAGDRREARVRAAYARALDAKNAEIARSNASAATARAEAETARGQALDRALTPPIPAAASCALPPEIIAALNRIR